MLFRSHVTVASLCYDSNTTLSFEAKRYNLMQADLSPFRRASEALAHIFQLLQAANTAYGSDFLSIYDLYKLVKGKSSSAI